MMYAFVSEGWTDKRFSGIFRSLIVKEEFMLTADSLDSIKLLVTTECWYNCLVNGKEKMPKLMCGAFNL